VFGTVLNYVAMRILGVSWQDEVMVKARGFIHAQGKSVRPPSEVNR
jgi:hypothetical protein